MNATDGDAPRLSRRRLIQLGVGAGVLGTGSALALGGVWAHDMTTDRVTVLGSGSELSLFITAGGARCLIAAGNQADEFVRTLGRCRLPTTRRVDLLLLAPSALGGVGDQALHVARGRYTARIGAANLTAITAHFGSLPVLPSPRRIRMPNDIAIEIEHAPSPDTTNPAPVWRMVISRGATRIATLSDASASTLFRPIGPVSVAICPNEAVTETQKTLPPRALIVGIDRDKLPLDIKSRGSARQIPLIFPVPAGQTLEMTWQPGGLRLSGLAPVPATAGTPVAIDAAPHL